MAEERKVKGQREEEIGQREKVKGERLKGKGERKRDQGSGVGPRLPGNPVVQPAVCGGRNPLAH